MGLYTDHWARYRQQSNRRTLQALLVVGVGLPATAACGYLLSPLTNVRTAVLVAIATAWLVTFTLLVLRGSRVDCPRCLTRYARGKLLFNCPRCGLRMLQEDP